MKWIFCIVLLLGGVIEFPLRFAMNVFSKIDNERRQVDWVPFLWRLVEKIVNAEVRT